jgi:xanthine dehydrogenase accessory factor
MDQLDVTVLRTLRDWRQAGRRALLATVVRTWGSSPRPEGSILALAEDGGVVGSVSGGCIEDDLVVRYAGAIQPSPPALVKYGMDAQEAHRFGLPCGGTLELLLEFDPDTGTLAQLVQALEQGRLMRRSVRLQDGCVTLAQAEEPAPLLLDSRQLAVTFGPAWRMLLIGAGQLAEYLATMALFNGFAVTVCDPRETYRGSWSVGGVRMETGMPDDVVLAFRPDARSCVVALTHDPKLDDLALMEAVRSQAFYVGAIGSRRNNAARRQRLRDHFGMDDAQLARLRGPVGIYIGSKTPAEIAVSIMAQVLAVRNGVALPQGSDVAEAKQSLAG